MLDTITVTGRPRPLSTFPGAVDVVGDTALRAGQRRVNLSESLNRVPGFTVRDRGNFAQDLQVQSRGYGARSTFGIRGLRLVADGIALSAADGQAQAAGFPLDTLDRIEVLRGPLALLHGNASGGALVGHSDLHHEPWWGVDAWADDRGARRMAARWDGVRAADWRWRVSGSHFRTPGVRAHAAAERSHGLVHGEWQPDTLRRLRLTVNSLSQPWTEDPLGLTLAQWKSNPRMAAPAAVAFDTRKRIGNHQLSVRWDQALPFGRAWWISVQGGRRDIEQFLAVPVAAQASPTSAGGVVDVDRSESGLEVGHRWQGSSGSLAVGLELGDLAEARRGDENFVGDVLGVRGRLRRDEDNRVTSLAVFAVAERALGAYSAMAGTRHVRSTFDSRDGFIAPGNGDDSGRAHYTENAVSLGIARKFGRGELFGSLGHGFETPTVTELSYRPDGLGGLNLGLQPARTRSFEVGTRWRPGRHRVAFTAYRITGRDEIVPASNSGGRATFANAGHTRREGMELGVEGDLGEHWQYAMAANWLRARFTRDFSYTAFIDGGFQERLVHAGNRMPGIPRSDAFAELAWHSADSRLHSAVEVRASDSVFADDRNTSAAPGHAVWTLRVSWHANRPGWQGFVRLDNIFDRSHVGSIIVNEGNGRFLEPGAGRTFTLGLGWHSR